MSTQPTSADNVADDKEESRRFSFTKSRLQKLPVPQKGRVDYHDEGCKNLVLTVSDKGGKVFYFYGRVNGRPSRLSIGEFPTKSVEQARGKCAAIRGGISEGRDVKAERAQRKEVKTLKQMFNDWLDDNKLRKRSWPNDQRMFDKYFTRWHEWKLSSITTKEVTDWHARAGRDNGPYQANRCRALLSTIFNHAKQKHGYAGINPCSNVKPFEEEERERFLQPEEAAAFFDAVATMPEKWRDFFLLCILTGQRKGNVQSMEWQEISFVSGVWTIPAAKSKAKKSIAVPLSPPALLILQTRYAANQTAKKPSNWVFPGRAGNHVTDPTKPWQTILDNSKIENLHIHDLRRSLGSWQASIGSSMAIIGKSLGHNDLASTQIYARLQLDPVRESVARAGAAMLEAAGKTGHSILNGNLVIDVTPAKENAQ